MPKISELNAATSVGATDVIPIVQSGETKKIVATTLTGWARTAAETSAGVTPSNLSYPPGDVRRYGADPTGVASSSSAIQNAIAVAAVSGGEVLFPAGTFLCSGLTITSSGVTIKGAGRGVTKLKHNANSALLTINSTSGTLERCRIADLSFVANGYVQPALYLTGSNPNDFHVFERLWFGGTTFASGGDGFYRSIKVDGRMIWSRLEDIDIRYDRAQGLWIETAQAVNLNVFTNVRVAYSQGSGIHLKKTSGADYHHSNNFFSCNSENNGKDTALAKNSGLYFYDVGETVLSGCYLENNGTGSTDNLDAALRTEGTWGGVSVYGGIYWGSKYGLKLDATLGWGNIDGARVASTTRNIDINATNSSSRFTILGYYESNTPSAGQGISAPVNVNADNFVASLIPFKLPLSSESAGALNLADKSLLRFTNSTPVTLTDADLTNAAPGHLLWIANEGSSTVTLTHGASLAVPGSASLVLATGQSAMLAKLTATKWVVQWWSHNLGGAYTVTNPSTSRALDVATATTAQLAAVVGTLIADLQSAKIIR